MSSSGDPSDTPRQPRGSKRSGDDSVNNEQRLAKRFHLLNLGGNDRNENLWIPTANAQVQEPVTPEIAAQRRSTDLLPPMLIDDTKDRIYIRNLDEELNLADVPDDDRIIFLPDIEKKLNKIPKHVLTGGDQPRLPGTELVLYKAPHSLSVPAEQDNVRRAILQSRARATEKASRDAPFYDRERRSGDGRDCHSQVSSANDAGDDEDAMEIG